MQDKYAKIQRFFTACDELISGKYILADNKIGELLKSIAASNELTTLFSAVTKDFDYLAAKQEYLKFPLTPNGTRGAAYLPTDRAELIAFVFCLLVEFDGGAMHLDEFLRKYFNEDGSYTASYALFVTRMIRPFRDIVRDCFPDIELMSDADALQERKEALVALGEKLTAEHARLRSMNLNPVDADACELIFAGLYSAWERQDGAEIKAMLCGYCYFLNVVGCMDENGVELYSIGMKL